MPRGDPLMASIGKVKAISFSTIALLGTAYAGTACSNPRGAVAISGQCILHHSDIGVYTDYYTIIDPQVLAGKCVAPGTNSVQCATQVKPFTYLTPVVGGEQGNDTGKYTTCYLDPTSVLMVDAFNLTTPCDYNRCD